MSCRGLEPKNVAAAMRFKISLFSRREKIVKQTFRIQAALAFTILFAVWLSGCGKEIRPKPSPPATLSRSTKST